MPRAKKKRKVKFVDKPSKAALMDDPKITSIAIPEPVEIPVEVLPVEAPVEVPAEVVPVDTVAVVEEAIKVTNYVGIDKSLRLLLIDIAIAATAHLRKPNKKNRMALDGAVMQYLGHAEVSDNGSIK